MQIQPGYRITEQSGFPCQRRFAAHSVVITLSALSFAVLSATVHANRGNTHGFSLAATSAVDYTSTPHTAMTDCVALTALAGGASP